jgi:hypothetical protein
MKVANSIEKGVNGMRIKYSLIDGITSETPSRHVPTSGYARITTERPETTRQISGTSEDDRWKLGGCPRCHGDVFLDSEDGELLGHCLQCGYVGTSVVISKSKQPW